MLKSFLYLHHKDVRSLITNFNSGFIGKIEQNWELIRNTTLNLFDLLKTYGLTDYTLTSYNATLPILYYIYHKNIYLDFSTKMCYQEDRTLIKNWLFSILLRRTFGASVDNILTQSRRAFTSEIEKNFIQSSNNSFPAKEINSEIKKITNVGDDFVEELLATQKDDRYSFPILAMLYPDMDYKNNNFHKDHLHPASTYDNLKEEDKEKYGWKTFNSILNLQMLDANENMSKQDVCLEDWIDEQTLNKDRDRFLANHLIPAVNFKLENFAEFIEKRKELLVTKLKSILN